MVDRQVRLGLGAVLAGAFLAKADFWLVNIALPQIEQDLRPTPQQTEFIVASFGGAYATLLIVAGRLGDAYGHARLFRVGVLLFALAASISGAAQNPEQLLVGRTLQGVGAAILVPQGLAVIQRMTKGRQRLRAIAAFSIVGGCAVLAGQLGGAAIITADLPGSSWRTAFAVALPISLLALALSLWLPSRTSVTPLASDWVGTLLLGASIGLALIVASEAALHGIGRWTLVGSACATCALLALRQVERRLERRRGSPILPPALWKIEGVSFGLALSALLYTSMGGFILSYTLMAQSGLGWSPAKTATSLVPFALAFVGGALMVTQVIVRFGFPAFVVGLVTLASGYAVMALETATRAGHALRPVDLAAGLVLVGVGQGLTTTPLTSVVLQNIPPALAGVGGGVSATVQQLAIAFGAVTLGGMYSAQTLSGTDPPAAFTLILYVQAVLIAVALPLSLGTRVTIGLLAEQSRKLTPDLEGPGRCTAGSKLR